MVDKKITTQVFDQTGKEIKKIGLNPSMFGVEVKESVVHQVMVAQMANFRVAIAHTKTRGEVRGGGKKPWKQKGTGRARHGSIRSPLWVGGGVTFGPRKERNFAQKVNKKMKRKALFMCLTDKVNDNLFFVLDKLNIQQGKTREMVDIFRVLKDILNLELRSKRQTTEKKEIEIKDKKINKQNKEDIKIIKDLEEIKSEGKGGELKENKTDNLNKAKQYLEKDGSKIVGGSPKKTFRRKAI